METIGIYELEYGIDGMCNLAKVRSTAFSNGYRADNTDKIAVMLNTIFYPTLKKTEYIYMIACDRNDRVLGLFIVASGIKYVTEQQIKNILLRAMMCNAKSIIMARNNPDMECGVNRDEIENLRKLKETATMLGITVKDNIILLDGEYISLAENGI